MGLDWDEGGYGVGFDFGVVGGCWMSITKHGHEHAAHGGRELPHCGSVNDLFGADVALVQEKEARDGGVLQGGVATARLSYLWEYKRKREKFPKRKGEKGGKGEFPEIY
jgi:hypothetical protein